MVHPGRHAGEPALASRTMTAARCVMCRRVEEKNDRWIAEFPLTVAYLNEDQFFAGYTLLIFKRHATELYHLERDKRAGMIEELSRLAEALETVFRPVKMNYELLGNQVPHIHWHLIPRLADDPLPRWPVWRSTHEPRHVSSEEYRARAAAIREAITPPLPGTAHDADAVAPDGSEIRLLATQAQGATRASLCEVRLGPGAISRPVYHRTVEEIWYVVEGGGRVWRCPPGAQADSVEVKPGDTLVIPTGWQFQFRAAPQTGLRFLCYTIPPWPGPDEAQPAEFGGLGDPTA